MAPEYYPLREEYIIRFSHMDLVLSCKEKMEYTKKRTVFSSLVPKPTVLQQQVIYGHYFIKAFLGILLHVCGCVGGGGVMLNDLVRMVRGKKKCTHVKSLQENAAFPSQVRGMVKYVGSHRHNLIVHTACVQQKRIIQGKDVATPVIVEDPMLHDPFERSCHVEIGYIQHFTHVAIAQLRRVAPAKQSI